MQENRSSAICMHVGAKFEIDSGASDTFCCEATWQTLGKPILQPVSVQYKVAEGSLLPVVGQFQSTASIDGKSPDVTFPVIVTKVPNLNLLGRLAIMKLKLTNLTDHLADTSLVRTIGRDCQGSNSCPTNAICEGGMAACIFGRA